MTGTCTQAPCNVITQYQYDRAGNRTAISDPLNHIRRFSYDADNRQATASDALGHVTSWDYDVGGRVTIQHHPSVSSTSRRKRIGTSGGRDVIFSESPSRSRISIAATS